MKLFLGFSPKALLTFSTHLNLGINVYKKALSGRFRWLLESMMRKQEIDIQELDYTLNYWENKAAIEAKYRTMLVLKANKLVAM
jgi:hypothetical protein